MNTEDNKQETKVAKRFIKPEEIQKGDLIKFTLNYKCGTKMTRKGVAVSNVNGATQTSWKDADGHYLFGTTEAESYTIELIDRPVSKIELPVAGHAVIEYYKGAQLWVGTKQVDGSWKLFANGYTHFPWEKSHEELTEMVNDRHSSRTGYKALFEGVAGL